MAETSQWQKYENKTSKKKNAKPAVNSSGDSRTAKDNANKGGSASIKNSTPLPVSNIFDDFLDGEDAKVPKTVVKNGKAGSKGRNGIKYITGEQLLMNGSVTSKFGETINFNTSSSELTSQPTKKPNKRPQPEAKPISYSVDLSCVKADAVTNEINSLAEVDQDKRCLSLAMFLNIQKLHQDPSGWETKSFDSNEPLASLPKPVENVLKQFIENIPETSQGISFDLVLAELLTKSQNSQATTWGYKVMLQLLARLQPEAAILRNHKSLSRLFGNSISSGGIARSNAIVWALLQPIAMDPVVALKVWSKIMLPHISNKSLAPVVCSSLDKLMSIDKLVMGNQTLSHSDYFHLLDYTFPQIGLQNVVDAKTHNVLQTFYPKLKMMASITSNVTNFFPSFLMRYKESQSLEMLDELMHCIVACLKASPKQSYEMWHEMIGTYHEQTRLFLIDLMNRWDDVPEVPRKELNKFLDRVQNTLTKNPTEKGILESAVKQCKDQLYGKPRKRVTFNSNSGSKSSSACCTHRSSLFSSPVLLVFVLVAICAMAEFKIRDKDSFTKQVVDSSSHNLRLIHEWFIKSYPKEAKYVKDTATHVYTVVQPKVSSAWNAVYKHVVMVFDYIYKDAPLKAYQSLNKNIFPGVNKFYRNNLERALSDLSRSFGHGVSKMLSFIDLEFLRPYLN